MKISAVIPAAGTGSRYGKNKNKLFEMLGNMPVIARTLLTVSSVEEISEIIVCTAYESIQDIRNVINEYKIPKVKDVIQGGRTRQESVFIGLQSCNNPDLVLIHDGARPLVSEDIIRTCLSTAVKEDGAIAAVPVKDTIKKANKNLVITDTLDRSTLWSIQTPQVFKYEAILSAHKKFKSKEYTDDSALIEKTGGKPVVVMGSYSNIKITTPEDLLLAEVFSKSFN